MGLHRNGRCKDKRERSASLSSNQRPTEGQVNKEKPWRSKEWQQCKNRARRKAQESIEKEALKKVPTSVWRLPGSQKNERQLPTGSYEKTCFMPPGLTPMWNLKRAAHRSGVEQWLPGSRSWGTYWPKETKFQLGGIGSRDYHTTWWL